MRKLLHSANHFRGKNQEINRKFLYHIALSHERATYITLYMWINKAHCCFVYCNITLSHEHATYNTFYMWINKAHCCFVYCNITLSHEHAIYNTFYMWINKAHCCFVRCTIALSREHATYNPVYLWINKAQWCCFALCNIVLSDEHVTYSTYDAVYVNQQSTLMFLCIILIYSSNRFHCMIKNNNQGSFSNFTNGS